MHLLSNEHDKGKVDRKKDEARNKSQKRRLVHYFFAKTTVKH